MKNKVVHHYEYTTAERSHAHAYLWGPLLSSLQSKVNKGAKVFDLCCGNGSTAKFLTENGYSVSGIDPSEKGIKQAKNSFPELNLEQGSCYDDLSKFGKFDAIVSLEVIEHVQFPREMVKSMYELLEDGGKVIISTPYHGYLKNLALAITGKMDQHFTALWDGGHIKFWSIETMSKLLTEAGFKNLEFQRIGRIPPLAKSMIVIAEK